MGGWLRSGTLGVACMTLLRASFSRVARPNVPSSLIRRRSRPAPLCSGPTPAALPDHTHKSQLLRGTIPDLENTPERLPCPGFAAPSPLSG